MGASFGAFLRALRQSHHLTLRQVEARVNVSIGYLSQIEQGVRGVPNVKTLTKLAEAYDVSVTELLEVAAQETRETSGSAASPKSRAAILLSMFESLSQEDDPLPSPQAYANEHLQKAYESLTPENKQRLIDYLDLLLYKQQHESRQGEQDV
jgi:transcriptional regulator with XRE-family HTH domain